MKEQLKQAKEMILGSKKLLIAVSPNSTGDVLLAASSLFVELKKIADEGPLFDSVEFLVPGNLSDYMKSLIDDAILNQIRTEIEGRSYVISFPCNKDDVERVSWKREDGQFRLFLMSSAGDLSFDDVSFQTNGADYEFVITLGTRDLESLGEAYRGNKKFFDQADHFAIVTGGAKAKQVLATGGQTISETVYSLMQELNVKFQTSTAQMLLEGIVAGVDGRIYNIRTSETFDKINALIRSGAIMPDSAEMQEKTGSYSQLQLQQRIFANIKQDPAGILWSRVDNYELRGLQISDQELDINRPLKFNICSGYNAAFVLFELADGSVVGRLETSDKDAQKLISDLAPIGSEEFATFKSNKSAVEIENYLLRRLRDIDYETPLTTNIETADKIMVESTEELEAVEEIVKEKAGSVAENVVSPVQVLPPVNGFVSPEPFQNAELTSEEEYSDRPIILGQDNGSAQFGPPQIFNSGPSNGSNIGNSQRGLF